MRKILDRMRFSVTGDYFLRPKCMDSVRHLIAGEPDPVRLGAMALDKIDLSTKFPFYYMQQIPYQSISFVLSILDSAPKEIFL